MPDATAYMISVVSDGETEWILPDCSLHSKMPSDPPWKTEKSALVFIREHLVGVYPSNLVHLFEVKGGKRQTISHKRAYSSDFPADHKETASVNIPDDLLEKIKAYLTLRENVTKYIDILNNDLSKYNGMQEDLLHFIELEKCPAPERLSIYSQLKDVRQKRREAKDFLEVLSAFLSETPDYPYNTFKAIERLSSRTYTPRALPELFDKSPVDPVEPEILIDDLDADSSVSLPVTVPEPAHGASEAKKKSRKVKEEKVMSAEVLTSHGVDRIKAEKELVNLKNKEKEKKKGK